jgi:GMP synthase-like glutamine amidotransferase
MKIGILQTGAAPDTLRSAGDYPDLFIRLLDGQGFDFATWRVLDGDIPARVTECDGWLITGSRHGVYEPHAWIPPLEQFIRDAFAAHVPVAGVCFGHQIMAQALGGRVEKHPGGWNVGPQTYDFGGERLTINAWHQDQVMDLPPGAQVVASSPACAYAALAYDTRGFSVQPHPEFGPDFVEGLINTRGRGVVPQDRLDTALAELDRPLDSHRIAQDIARFFKMTRTAA